jgi:nitrite reductase/ring-hydroxylating ferredoxin subunit
MPTPHTVCRADELPPGTKKIIQIGKKSIGVFNIADEYFALLNVCPHQMAPLCEGRICGYSPPSDVGEFKWEREGEIIRCPWHGWEFDIKTGKSIFNPHRVRTASYPAGITEESVETFPVEIKQTFVVVMV